MTEIKTKIEFAVQGQMNGGTHYDIAVYRSERAAEKLMNRILRQCYPKWRGMDMGVRIVRRLVSVKIESEIRVFTSRPEGKKRMYLAELIVPDWLPRHLREKYKELPIPGKEQL